MTKYEDVKHLTTEEYFRGNQFSIDAFNKKYASFQGETYIQALHRVCEYIAQAEETPELQKYWYERWYHEIYEDLWHPAGSIMQGADATSKISMMNCTHISLPDDSLEGIIRYNLYRVAKTAAYRQGLGVDFSRIRPKMMAVNNSSNVSEGSIHWMKLVDSIGYYVGQRGRIPAMLFSLDIHHMDIEDFINLKVDRTRVQNANISVQITEDFYEAVEKDADWELRFELPEVKKGQKIYLDPRWDDMRLAESHDKQGEYFVSKFNRKTQLKTRTLKAKYLLELIAKNMHAHAEPGIQNIEMARRYSNSDAVGFPIVGTNACSEQYLDNQGNCDLASMNCAKFYDKLTGKYDRPKMREIARSMNRFLDDVITMEVRDDRFATPEQKNSLLSLRRVGCGVTNIVGLLFQARLEYGSKEGNKFMEDFMNDFNYELYQSSIDLGKEKGSFLAFDKEKIKNSQFIKNLLAKHNDITLDFLRNVCLTSIAPTGTLSLMFRDTVLSYGIEPSFFKLYYEKRTRISGKYEYYFVVPSVVREAFEEAGIHLPMDSDTIKDDWAGTKSAEIRKIIDENAPKLDLKIRSSVDITPMEKLDLMARIQKSVDSSISVTYMLPETSKWEDIYDFILEAHKRELKSIAAFPDKKMYGIVSSMPFKELAFKLKNEGIEIHPQNFSDEELKELNLSKESSSVNTTDAPKRLKELDADIYSVTVRGEKYCMAVGLQNGRPYELFGGLMNGLNFKFNYKKGKIIKEKRGKYKLEIGDLVVDDFAEQFKPAEQMLFRMVSLNLRHGVPMRFIVEQLQKSAEDVTSISAAAARTLKRYIKDGETVSGATCPNCGSKDLIYEQGCYSCPNCGNSKCS
jgi:ribonucleoside-diphosphate reductase alpha chain